MDAAVSLTKLASIFNDEQLKNECDAFLATFADRPCTILAPKVQTLFSLLASCCGEYVKLYSVPALLGLFLFMAPGSRHCLVPCRRAPACSHADADPFFMAGCRGQGLLHQGAKAVW